MAKGGGVSLEQAGPLEESHDLGVGLAKKVDGKSREVKGRDGDAKRRKVEAGTQWSHAAFERQCPKGVALAIAVSEAGKVKLDLTHEVWVLLVHAAVCRSDQGLGLGKIEGWENGEGCERHISGGMREDRTRVCRFYSRRYIF